MIAHWLEVQCGEWHHAALYALGWVSSSLLWAVRLWLHRRRLL